MNGLFVTGTDTGCGKTEITLALMDYYQSTGMQVIGFKPVASGADMTGEGLRNEDALRIQRQNSILVPYNWVNPHVFEPPVAPHIAASGKGTEIDLNTIIAEYQRLAELADLVIVEGVGGLLVPLNERENLADLIQQLRLPTLMVAGLKLGGINHALLTAEALSNRHIPMLGWVANGIDPDMLEAEANLLALKKRIHFPYLGHIPAIQGKISIRAISDLFRDFFREPKEPIL